jgi:hypothetical protein
MAVLLLCEEMEVHNLPVTVYCKGIIPSVQGHIKLYHKGIGDLTVTLWGCWLGCDADHSSPSSTEVVNEWQLYLLSPYPSIGVLWTALPFTPFSCI